MRCRFGHFHLVAHLLKTSSKSFDLLLLLRELGLKVFLQLCVSQCSGAVAASLLLRLLFPSNAALGATVPAGSQAQSFVLEMILTALLMFVILNVSTGAKEKGITAGIAVGAVIGLEALFAGPICGASMNPARSFGPALVSGHASALWIYLVAPITGALVAVFGCICVQEEGCCTASEAAH